MIYIDMMNVQSSEHQTFSIDEDNFEGPNEDEVLEFNQIQYTSKLRHIIETHDTKWIEYKPERCQNTNPFDGDGAAADDNTISSVERI